MLFERQQYQEDCVSNIVSVLDKTDDRLAVSLPALTDLQQKKSIREKKRATGKQRLDVLMETGTGKTFTYLKTMYELNRQFGTTKFIVFVPRVAIRAVVCQNIDLTADYFFQEYGKRLKKHIYGESGDLSQVMDYIRDESELSVLILTSASITSTNKNNRKLTSRNENMLFECKSPLDAISKLQPVVVIDEPHLLKGKGFTEKYSEYFSDSVCIRFGATYPTEEDAQLANVVYELDSITSFCEYLVKKIRVSTVIDNADSLKFYHMPGARNQRVRLNYFRNKMGHSKIVNIGDSISAITGNVAHDYSIVRMDKDTLYLNNGTTRQFSADDYALEDESIRWMIKETINIHFEKEEELFNQNIKTLSLFFIPAVADFRGDNPRVKKIFDEEYAAARKSVLERLKPEQAAYRDYLQRDYDADGNLRVREGYFSGDKGASEAKELYGINLILNDKAKLLSTAEPLRFIFSVWALQEGWDNPNIFTICKLAPAGKETSRRQQVGRGLRLAVNNEGRRQTLRYFQDSDEGFYGVNMLDVVVSGQEEGFIEEIQKEIVGNAITANRITEEMLSAIGLNKQQRNKLIYFLEEHEVIRFCDETVDGYYEIVEPIADFLRGNKDNLPEPLKPVYDQLIRAFSQSLSVPIENRNKPADTVQIRAEKFKEFEKLWKTITRKAKIIYRDINDDTLINTVREAFAQETIDPLRQKITIKTYNHQENRIDVSDKDEGYSSAATAPADTAKAAPDSAADSFISAFDYAVFIKDFSDKENLPLSFCLKLFAALDKQKIAGNPRRAREVLSAILKESVHKSIIHGIHYQLDSEINISTCGIFYEDSECEQPKQTIEANALGKYSIAPDIKPPSAHYLYEKIVYDSLIEKESAGNEPQQINNKRITVFAKLPKISIPTPYKSYNPDFAYFIQDENDKQLFLIVETKGYNLEADIPYEEKCKIEYAKKFFAMLNDTVENVDIVYKTRISKQSLADMLRNIGADT